MCHVEEKLYHRSWSKRRKTFYIYDVLKETCGQLMKAKYILEVLLLKGMKIVLDSAKEAFIVLQIHSNETY